MELEQYRAKKLDELRKKYLIFIDSSETAIEIEAFLSQTIDELWALPEKKGIDELNISECMKTLAEKVCFREGYLFCIAEAERMRDNKLSEKR